MLIVKQANVLKPIIGLSLNFILSIHTKYSIAHLNLVTWSLYFSFSQWHSAEMALHLGQRAFGGSSSWRQTDRELRGQFTWNLLLFVVKKRSWRPSSPVGRWPGTQGCGWSGAGSMGPESEAPAVSPERWCGGRGWSPGPAEHSG